MYDYREREPFRCTAFYVGGKSMISQNISGTQGGNIGEMIPHIVQTACAYKSVITFEVNEKRVNAKSIMGVMALASQDSPKIKIYADGEDEEEAVKKIASLLG
jgi:phosphotransferase system HPr (HPr) family protein